MLRQMNRGTGHDRARFTRALTALVATGLAAATFAGCSVADPNASQAAVGQTAQPFESVQGTLRVFAASSLSSAFAQLATAFEQTNPGIEVEINFAASSALREQILDGAPAHVFASANERVMADLVQRQDDLGSPVVFATNHLVLVTRASSNMAPQNLASLEDESLFVGLCAPDAPCGQLAAEILAEREINAVVDTFEPNARALTNRLRDGDLDIGLVYATDAANAADDLVVEQTFPTVVTTYPIAARTRAGQLFVDYVTSEAGQAILASWGFGEP